MEKILQLVTVLFILSLIFERICEFLKTYLACKKLGPWFIVGDTITKHDLDSKAEKRREYRILKMNLVLGFITAFLAHASFFDLLKNIETPGKVIGWTNNLFNDFQSQINGEIIFQAFKQAVQFIIGCLFTGAFISTGSKFWHDLLDTLFQIKNYKRLLADPDTYAIDNIKDLDNAVTTYGSEVVQSAYLKIKSELLAKGGVLATAIKHDEEGYFISVTLEKDNNTVTDFFEYKLDNGQIKNIRIKKSITSEKIVPHSINLSDKIYNTKSEKNWGTIGCLVKRKKEKGTYVLTCYHNVVEPGSDFKFNKSQDNNASLMSNDDSVEAKVVDARRDYEIDAALISLNDSDVKNIINKIPGVGSIKGIRDDITTNNIPDNIKVFMHGAADSEIRRGYIDGLHADVSISYPTGKHELLNLISISNNGKAISEGGDSGACILDFDNNVIGILVGGSSETSYAIPINSILNKMSLELITQK